MLIRFFDVHVDHDGQSRFPHFRLPVLRLSCPLLPSPRRSSGVMSVSADPAPSDFRPLRLPSPQHPLMIPTTPQHPPAIMIPTTPQHPYQQELYHRQRNVTKTNRTCTATASIATNCLTLFPAAVVPPRPASRPTMPRHHRQPTAHFNSVGVPWERNSLCSPLSNSLCSSLSNSLETLHAARCTHPQTRCIPPQLVFSFSSFATRCIFATRSSILSTGFLPTLFWMTCLFTPHKQLPRPRCLRLRRRRLRKRTSQPG